MTDNKNFVLVPVNFSEEAENGAVYALQIAAGLNADIVLLNTYFNPALYVPGMLEPFTNLVNIEKDIRAMEKEAEINLVALKQMLDKKIKTEGISNVEVTFDLVQGYPANAILSYAEAFKPNVIIMGSPGNKPGSTQAFGKVITKIMEAATAPVIAVPQDYNAYQFTKPQKVLYLTSLDHTDYPALERLTGFARFFDARIFCVHTSTIQSDESDEEKMRKIKKYIVEQLEVTNPECGILETANPLSGLEKFITKRSIDIIAFSTQKRNMLLRFFMPDSSHYYLYQTGIPLLVYHAK